MALQADLGIRRPFVSKRNIFTVTKRNEYLVLQFERASIIFGLMITLYYNALNQQPTNKY